MEVAGAGEGSAPRARPIDPVGDAVAKTVSSLLGRATVHLDYSPEGSPPPDSRDGAGATAPGPPGWQTTITVRLGAAGGMLTPGSERLLPGVLATVPDAALRAATRWRHQMGEPVVLTPPMRRALRDTVVIELLGDVLGATRRLPARDLVADTLEFLIELSGTRVESHDLTHGVIITDALPDEPRIELAYPEALRAAKRSALLFDGQQSVLVVDRAGRARTELQRHRLDRLIADVGRLGFDEELSVESGSLVALASLQLGGLGFFLRADRSIWAFADGSPVVVRRGEHWTTYPVELAAAVDRRIGGSAAAPIVVRAAFTISAQRHGAILAIVDDPVDLEGVVAPKDRYDLRDRADPRAVNAETRLHHLIDAGELDHHTLARLASLDGATVLDREGRLLAYGAIIASHESKYEGARTSAARTLSERAAIVLKVSEDGEITLFREGRSVATLLRSGPPS